MTNCCYLWTMHKPLCYKHRQIVRKVYSLARENGEESSEKFNNVLKRREDMLLFGTGLVSTTVSGEGHAVVKQGLLAGRIPGLSEPDDQDLGDNVKIEQIGTPEKVISAFGPEVIGENVEGKVLSMKVTEHSGRKYYQFELEPPHAFITATAAGNRLYLFNVTANGLQWKRHYKDLKKIADSFRIV